MANLTLPEFIARWQASTRTERSGAQEHFLDLCDVLGQSRPAQVDPKGEWFTFEKGAAKTGGGGGFADVWMRDHFGWEYKGKRKNLDEAYQQLLQYREDLENPPLLVVCDLNRFEVHTNFTGTAKRVYSFSLADLASPTPTPTSPIPPLEVLRSLFIDPNRLRSDRTAAQVTEKAAAEFALLAENLRKRGADPEKAAHFLMRILFCLFAEDTGLLPRGLFTQLVDRTRQKPEQFNALVKQLFSTMATGGWFGVENIAHFNGGLFADDAAQDLTADDLAILARAGSLDWASIEPAIFGTLFERSLDPSKRSQLGAHYTSREDILLIVEPVLMAPLRARWEEIRNQAQVLIVKRDAEDERANREEAFRRKHRNPYKTQLERLILGFLEEIASIRVLDPACGSGNFLYVALKHLLDLEKEVTMFAAANGVPGIFTKVDPSQLFGIEINPYAHELASIVVWIGYIQWLYDNGFGIPSEPILKPLHNIRHMDAILAHDEQGKPMEPEWPEADVIIGNPPFVGGNRVRQELGNKYVDSLFDVYRDRVPAFSDLVCYWYEHTRQLIANRRTERAGLLATNSIRQGVNRRVLERIKESGDIFMAWSDRQWVLEGAAVRVSVIGFDNGKEKLRTLNGEQVLNIHADLTATLDMLQARRLSENMGICFIGTKKAGSFDIDSDLAQKFLSVPSNPNGRPNSDVVYHWINGISIVRRPEDRWIISFGEMPMEQAALYEQPFEYVREIVYPERQQNNEERARVKWWQHRRPATEMREAIARLSRYIATARVSKYRLFVWIEPHVIPDDRLYVFAREDDYFFGILHSHLHEVWALRLGSTLEDRPTYTPTTCFETYPFPYPPGHEPKDDPRVKAISEGARDLVQKRDAWLNPPDASEAELKKRTLTSLYNQRPTWLDLAHKKLDQAVFDAYSWPHDLTDEQILEQLLALNLERVISQEATLVGPH